MAPGGPPFLTKEIQKQMEYKDGDIIVSVPAKSGTTWTMNICYQLREGGNSEFTDLYKEVPWLEFLIYPNKTVEDICREIKERPENRRIFKTHSAPHDDLPYLDPDDQTTPQVKYVVIFRNPEEALGSFQPFLIAHNPEFFKLWGMPGDSFRRFHDMETFYNGFFIPGKLYMQYFGNLQAWWPLRHKSNVLLMHFNDMKTDHLGTVRKISDFLGFEPTEDQWEKVLEYTSFPWMKENCRKFEFNTFFDFPFMTKGGMIRRGTSGMQGKDGVTEEMALDLKEIGKKVLTDEVAFEWLYKGGTIS